MSTRLSYEEWNDRLCAHFFSPRYAGQLVTLFVDDDTLADIAGTSDAAEAVESLADAVKRRLGGMGGLFKPIVLETMAWKRDPHGCPPSLPLLALAVLAAHNMEREAGISPQNYYLRFRELLGLPLSGGEPNGYGDALPVLWKALREWLDQNEGRLGVSTIPVDPFFPFIGFALSQALFRESDRQRLTHFFQWIELSPGEHIEEAELLTHFRNWARGGRPISPGLARAAEDDRFAGQLGHILTTAAEHWDGVLRDEGGRRLAQIHVTLDSFPRPQLAFAAERPVGFPPEMMVSPPDGSSSFNLAALTDEWYGAVPIAMTASALDEGLKVVSGDFSLIYHPSPVVVLRQATTLGLWASVSAVAPDVPHWVLVRENHLARAKAFLGQYADEGWRQTQTGCPDGWTLLGQFIVADVADPTSIDADLRHLVPSAKNRPTLKGGLPMPGGQSTYLVGGEPDAWVPAPAEGSEWPAVMVDGQTHALSAGRLALRKLGLTEGLHEATIGQTRLVFATIDTISVNLPAGAATLANKLVFRDGQYLHVALGASAPATLKQQDEVLVAGAHCSAAESILPTDLHPPVFLETGAREYVLLGARPGQIARLTEPLRPAWIRKANLYLKYFEAQPRFPVAWVLTRWPNAGWSTQARNTLEPGDAQVSDSSPDNLVEWCEAVSGGEPPSEASDLDRWSTYVGVARRLQG